LIQIKYLDTLVRLAIFVMGISLTFIGYHQYGITPVIVGLVLVIYYRKYLIKLMTAF